MKFAKSVITVNKIIKLVARISIKKEQIKDHEALNKPMQIVNKIRIIRRALKKAGSIYG
jgi:hypothetical protein